MIEKLLFELLKKRGSSILKDVFDVVYKAADQNKNALLYTSNVLKDCYIIVNKSIEQKGISLKYASINFKKNKESV